MAQSKVIARYTNVDNPDQKYNVIREGNHFRIESSGAFGIRIGEPVTSQSEVMKEARMLAGLGK